MTFKHEKFEDSATLRSLEKIAKEKGWVSPSLKKTASITKKADISVTDNLLENILHLCAGLRETGFDKYADELEGKYLEYKQAHTLYETSGEKGEDLVDAAHPKGSHKLENVDSSESVIETILDQHLKILEKIEKKPTGKLSEASRIIESVKIVLGQVDFDQLDVNAKIHLRQLYAYGFLFKIGGLLNDIYSIYTTSYGHYDWQLAEFNKRLGIASSIFNSMMSFPADAPAGSTPAEVNANNITGTNLENLADAVRRFNGWWFTKSSGGDDPQISAKVKDIQNRVSYAMGYLRGDHDDVIKAAEAKKLQEAPKLAMEAEFKKEVDNLTDWKAQVNNNANLPDDYKKQVSTKIDAQIDKINKAPRDQDQLTKFKQENSVFFNQMRKAKLVA